MHTKLQVGNLGEATGSAELERLFAPYGTVRSAVVIRLPETGASAGYGLVEMESAPHAVAAIAALDGRPHGDRQLSVTRPVGWGGQEASADPRWAASPRGPRPGGFGDRGGEGGGGSSSSSSSSSSSRRGGRRESSEEDRRP